MQVQRRHLDVHDARSARSGLQRRLQLTWISGGPSRASGASIGERVAAWKGPIRAARALLLSRPMPNVRRIGAALAIALIGCSARDAASERLGEDRQPIIKGTDSSSDQDDVILVAWRMQGQDFQACSGELVAPNLVLTAHHCVGNLDEN